MLKAVNETWFNLYQILLAIILLLIGFVLSMIEGTQSAMLNLINLLGEIECFGPAMNFAQFFVLNYAPGLSGQLDAYLQHLINALELLNENIYEMLSIALCVKILTLLQDIFLKKGIHLVAIVLGVFCGCLIVRVYDIPVLALAFLFLLLMVIDMIFHHETNFNVIALLVDYIKIALELTLLVLALIFVCGFMAVFFVIWQVGVDSIVAAILLLVMFMLPLLGILFVNKYLLGK